MSAKKLVRKVGKRPASQVRPNRRENLLSADELKMLRVIGDKVVSDLGGKDGLIAHSAEYGDENDPVASGEWRWNVASELGWLTKRGQEATDDDELHFPDPKLLTKRFHSVEAGLIQKKWLYIEDGDLIFGTRKMWDWYLSQPLSAEPSSPTTPSTEASPVEPVEDVEGLARKPELEWPMEAGLDRNFNAVGKLLVSLGLPLFRHSEGGLLLVEDDKPLRITSAKELAPFLIDTIRIKVTKNGNYHGEKPSDSILNNMLRSRSFLDHFATVEELVKTPIVLPGFVPSQPGFNEGGILHLGPLVAVSRGISTINTFLDVMEWQGNADRTNAVAALLTVPFRRHFTGGKPLILVTASQSHAGKGTLIDFIRGRTAKADILYENIDWPMQRQLHEQLHECPDVGVISFDNVRIDSSGRAKIIRSGFLESFITNSEIVVSSTARRPIRMANRFLVLLNTNEGSLSIDLLNRSLPIRLAPSGDVTDRIAKAKSVLGGDVKHEWLPAHRDQIEAELWGMIDRWVQEGRPFDTKVKHPMGPWAKTIGGILMVNGFTDFLDNYSATRAAADPIREAISILAFHAGAKPQRAAFLASLCLEQGLVKTLLPGADPYNGPACERAMGVVLSPFVGQTFIAATATERVTYRLDKRQGRFDKSYPHFRYVFEEVKREQIDEKNVSGLVLERSSREVTHADKAALAQYQPEVVQ